MLQAIEKPELNSDPRYSSQKLRIQNYLTLNDELQPIFQRKARGEWMAILDRYHVDYVVFNTGEALSNVLATQPAWKVVYQDKVATIFFRAG